MAQCRNDCDIGIVPEQKGQKQYFNKECESLCFSPFWNTTALVQFITRRGDLLFKNQMDYSTHKPTTTGLVKQLATRMTQMRKWDENEHNENEHNLNQEYTKYTANSNAGVTAGI